MNWQETIESISFFNRFRFTLNSGFEEHTESYPSNEAGEFIKRQMAKKSWFDRLTSWWVGHSFIRKISYISSLALGAGVIGSIVGAPLLFSFFVLFLSFWIHKLFTYHEDNRKEAAYLAAAEAMALIERLDETQSYFSEAADRLEKGSEVLHSHADKITIQIQTLDSEEAQLAGNDASLSAVVSDVTLANQNLTQRVTVVSDTLQSITTHLADCDKSITTLNRVISDPPILQRHPTNFSKHFSLFAEDFSGPSTGAAEDGFLNQLKNQNEEDEELIKMLMSM